MTGDTSVDDWGVVERAVELARQGEAFAMATVVWRQGPSSGQHGSRAIVTASGELYGWIGGACAEPVFIREAQRVIETGQPKLLWLGQPDSAVAVPEGVTAIPMSCHSEGALHLYVEPVLSAPRIVVVGRSPMAQALADMAAAIGWNAQLADGDELTSDSLAGSSAVVVATQGHGDEEVLERVLADRPAYVGLVASHKRGAAVLGYLSERGVDEEALRSIRFPAGLDLGHTTHREVAVAVLAELVQLRASGVLAPEAPVTPPAPAEAIDPVCGMTVTATPDHRPFDHDGRTYYFCSPGCRSAFEKDPAAYVSREAAC